MQLNSPIPDYIAQRIRRPPPQGCNVIAGSIPVVGFGNWRQASVATVGINPGPKTFLPTPQVETLDSFGITSLSDASDNLVRTVLENSDSYFQRNYGPWFKKIEKVLIPLNVNYRDGSACHLDIVQWATNPAWGKLSVSIKKQLVKEDAGFLYAQLEHSESIHTVLLNGRTVIDQFPMELREIEPLARNNRPKIRLFVGRLFDRIQVIGWNINIQSSFGVSSEDIEALSDKVSEMAG